MILNKLLGVGCILAGFFFVVYLPDTEEFQYPNWTMAFILFGIFLMIFGIYLVKVG